jgi:hypothetical protein
MRLAARSAREGAAALRRGRRGAVVALSAEAWRRMGGALASRWRGRHGLLVGVLGEVQDSIAFRFSFRVFCANLHVINYN